MSSFPWRPTLREFVEVAVSNGYDLATTREPITDPEGRSIHFDYLRKVEGGVKMLVILTGLGQDERLTETTLRSLCVQAGVPGDLFNLSPEEPYEGDE